MSAAHAAFLTTLQTTPLAATIADLRRKAAVYRRWSTSGRMAPAMAHALLEDDLMESGLVLEAGELLRQPVA